jgi:hypothetical protein
MAQPWIGVRKLAAVPTPNTQFDPPLASVDNFANIVMRLRSQVCALHRAML